MESLAYLLTAIAVIIGYYYKKHYKRNLMASVIPGPPVSIIPLLGNGLLFINKSPSGLFEFIKNIRN